MHPQSFFRFSKFKQRLSNSPWLWAEVWDGFIRLFVHTTAVGDCIFIGSDLCVGVCVCVECTPMEIFNFIPFFFSFQAEST